MKPKLSLIIGVFLLIIVNAQVYADSGNDLMAKYYSRVLTYNLNHMMDLTKNLYHLSMEISFNKEYLEDNLIRLENEIAITNRDIASMIKYIPQEKVQLYLDRIDMHLSQVYIDIKTLREGLNKTVDIPGLVSDIYYQIEQAEKEDHLEINKILNFSNNSLPEIPKIER